MEAADGVVDKLFMGNTSAGVLTGVIVGVLTTIDAAAVLVGVNVNVFAGAMTAFEFAMPGPLGCSAAFDCRPMTALDCDSVLHAWIPSYHV